ncbi:hypothetical protein BZG36_03995 [Bifiguratus adelaidae]|uniref:Sec63-domain-containing protein n=1 Tax=Bifiguratus adelaidae TaxID=1938954 RepID=A0A261Y1Q3_9FUNG|nr:hypothetical protein BZG36_03995 [Bifiguratus adelaidae]
MSVNFTQFLTLAHAGHGKGKGKGKSVEVSAPSFSDMLKATRESEPSPEVNGKTLAEQLRRVLAEFKNHDRALLEDAADTRSGKIELKPYPDLFEDEAYESMGSDDSGEHVAGLDSYLSSEVAFTQDHHHEATGFAAPDVYDRNWLLEQSKMHLATHVGDSPLSAEELCVDIFASLYAKTDEDVLQANLVDLLGFDNLEFVTTLVSHRSTIVDDILAQSDFDPSTPASRGSGPIPRAATPTFPSSDAKRPNYGAQVTVQTEEEKRELKQFRKEQKKAMRAAHAANQFTDPHSIARAILTFDSDDNDKEQTWRKAREEALQAAANAPLFSSPHKSALEETYPNVYQSSKTGNVLNMFGSRYALPVGTEREEYLNYEEITIPVSRQAPVRTHERRIPISELDNLCSGAFKGYDTLNRVQSIVYPIAYETNENMLVCAPTGAGKTDVAMLTVLRCISQYCDPKPSRGEDAASFSVSKNDFKIVYVAPMKALAAEVVQKLGKRLSYLGISVKELTGDMQLTKTEIVNTQIIVTTPEKWDVVTRKATGDTELAQKVRLLIIDEVHLLHEDRGAVIESIIARTLRQVESSQSLIRIVGLSATLPNYVDVSAFLRVNPYQGLFYFDSGFRPVPLEQHFLGIKGKANTLISNEKMNTTCWEKVSDLVRAGHQIMVFVHARKETVKTAKMLQENASLDGLGDFFDMSEHPRYELYKKDVSKSRNKELRELFQYGFGIHHAGMLRSDRNLVEKLFGEGILKVLCCTATLAWGVNLPAYAVVIKGTQIYDSQKGSFVDLSILDVLQIFGRAGRPQYEDMGVGYILTTHDKLGHYVSAMTQQHPIESRFIENMVDNLNAEIALGTVTNVDEAVTWLSYTYLYVRMKKNPLVYGMDHTEPSLDPLLGKRRRDLIVNAARKLAKAQMIIFDENTGYLTAKDLGRIASNFYIKHGSIEIFNTMMKPRMTEADVLAMVSLSSEFDNVKARDTEAKELTSLSETACACAIKGGVDSSYGKVNILLQAYISNAMLDDFALVSDSAYVAQNAGRIVRALFEIALNRSWGPTASVLLSVNKAIEKRMWTFEHPLGQFGLPRDIIHKLEDRSYQTPIEEMRDMSPQELGQLVRNNRFGATLSRCVDQFPSLQIDAKIAPITRNVLNIDLTITPDFLWNDRIHGTVEPWWIWAEDSENTEIYYSEYFVLNKKQLGQPANISFTIPLIEPLPSQVYVRAVSDRWLGAETVVPISFKHLILPDLYPPHTDLLDLQPLPISALHDEVLEEICGKRFTHFNPVQTQIFHTLYNSSHNALVGAPTGSGKTVAAELAMWWAFRENPGSKVVYIAPMKALVRERVADWRKRLIVPMKKKLVELTGDVTPDLKSIEAADIIITTPEKWDGISRSWQTRRYVREVSCVIIDEIHLLGGDRGPILEVIVSRMNYIGSQLERKIRIVGLSTALANARDLADWLGIKDVGLFNFRHSVRPVPLEIYIDGFPGKAYCPRMATMNKPTYAAIKTHSPTQPVIVFVSSRRQTRLTAQDLIAYCGMEDNPRQWLRMDDDDLEMILLQTVDESLKMSLAFGIGLHHAGLTETDRKLVEELFVNMKIQVLIATSTLAWGVNFPAHLVVVKGTEYYNYKVGRYQDFPITDVLQMMGRAGRPQFDNKGIARIFVQDTKKNFFKKFLHEPFPVESSLHKFLDDHINAEVVAGTIKSKQDAMDYMTWTYFYRRLQQNPTYYGMDVETDVSVESFLSSIINQTIKKLVDSGCVEVIDDFEVEPTISGTIASYYYLRHETIRLFRSHVRKNSPFEELLELLSNSDEYSELPVRCNEDLLNKKIESEVKYHAAGDKSYISPHVKAFVLLQAHLARLELPISDYITDQVTVLDQAIRLMQAMIDVAADAGMLNTAIQVMHLVQSVKQARWSDDSSISTLPWIEPHMTKFLGGKMDNLLSLVHMPTPVIERTRRKIRGLSDSRIQDILQVVSKIPNMEVKWHIDTQKPHLIPESMYNLQLNIRRHTRAKQQKPDGRVYSPRFPKPQYESWWIILGNEETGELLALKRLSMRNGPEETLTSTAKATIQFQAPAPLGKHQYTLYLMSDGYMGIDQKLNITFEVRTDLDV